MPKPSRNKKRKKGKAGHESCLLNIFLGVPGKENRTGGKKSRTLKSKKVKGT